MNSDTQSRSRLFESFDKMNEEKKLTKVGVNGSDVYTDEGVGDMLLAFYTSLNRDMKLASIKEFMDKIVGSDVPCEVRKKAESETETAERETAERDLFTLAFQTRDIRGGKGERKLFYHMMDYFCVNYKGLAPHLFELIGEFGYYKDIFRLMPLNQFKMLDKIVEHIKKDSESERPSLLCKWLPRETSKKSTEMARLIAGRLRPYINIRTALKEYRKMIAQINKKLKTTEINMCGKDWRHIEPSHVPGRCFMKNRLAFLNEKKNRRGKQIERYPDNEDRVECAKNFKMFMNKVESGEKKMKGGDTLYLHEIVEKYYYDSSRYSSSSNISEEEDRILQAMWNAIRDKTAGDSKLRKTVPLCDFSGSMDGVPMLVSLALGILISEINDEAFRDGIITFDSKPSWFSFKGKTSLKDKLDHVCKSKVGQGYSTNFEAACRLVLDRMVEAKIKPGEEPEDLLVLTDMGWDAASGGNYGKQNYWDPITGDLHDGCVKGGWKTHLTLLKEAYKAAGESLWGEGNGWKMPRIVIWNLSAQFKDYHFKADEEGVVVLSGWSPSVLKYLQNNLSPKDCFYEMLYDKRYDVVRAKWNEYKASRKEEGKDVE
jgi:hypothetical protein